VARSMLEHTAGVEKRLEAGEDDRVLQSERAEAAVPMDERNDGHLEHRAEQHRREERRGDVRLSRIVIHLMLQRRRRTGFVDRTRGSLALANAAAALALANGAAANNWTHRDGVDVGAVVGDADIRREPDA
jgi:hypothetical protein